MLHGWYGKQRVKRDQAVTRAKVKFGVAACLRVLLGVVVAGAVVAPALAGQMNADEARNFVAVRFSRYCFDGTRGAGRMLDDMGAAGAVQFSGAGPVRHMRLPGNTLQVRGRAVCASIKGIPFEPCFNLEKKTITASAARCRAWVSPIAFPSSGRAQMLMARAVARPRSLRAPGNTRWADASADRDVGERRNPEGRERGDRAGEIRGPIGTGEIGRRPGTAPARPTDFSAALAAPQLGFSIGMPHRGSGGRIAMP